MIGLRVVIAGQKKKTVKAIEEMLKLMGCVVVGLAYDEFGALKVIRATQPDFIILEAGLPFIEVAKTVEENMLAPLLLITDRECWNFISPVMDTWGFEYLEKPIRTDTLRIKMIVGNDKYRKNMEDAAQVEQINSEKTTRNIVDRAKDILVNSLGLSEVQAICRIQILGHDSGLSLRDMAKRIITEYKIQKLNLEIPA